MSSRKRLFNHNHTTVRNFRRMVNTWPFPKEFGKLIINPINDTTKNQYQLMLYETAKNPVGNAVHEIKAR